MCGAYSEPLSRSCVRRMLWPVCPSSHLSYAATVGTELEDTGQEQLRHTGDNRWFDHLYAVRLLDLIVIRVTHLSNHMYIWVYKSQPTKYYIKFSSFQLTEASCRAAFIFGDNE